MGTKLYVGNLNYNTTEEELREVFGEDGRQVSEVAIVMDRETGRPRGFAFVTMGSEADAKAAIEALNGHSLGGRTIKVNESQDRRGPRNGAGGGHRSGGRGGDRGGGGGRRGGGFERESRWGDDD